MRQGKDEVLLVVNKTIARNLIVNSLVRATLLLSLTHCGAINAHLQSIQPAYPATEYIRMNGQLIAVEHLPLASTSINVSVSPENVTLGPSQQQQFRAIITGTSNTAVSWSISPNFGAITQAGLYTAPTSIAAAPIVTVTAI